jgi:hypothetical protein
MRRIAAVPRRLANAFVVLFGQHGDVSREAEETGQTRQTMYRDTQQVVAQVSDCQAEGEIQRLRQELARERARADGLVDRLEETIEQPEEMATRFASTAQAEGVSLPVARRLLSVVMGKRTPSVSSLGRKTAQVAEKSAQLLEVLDVKVRPQIPQAAADEIFLGNGRS